MKKSEKIEIRISYEEKKSLARLAESEGHSVSELVRGLARKYAQLNMPLPRRKFSRQHMAGLILCGIGIGSGFAFSLNGNLSNNRGKQFMVHGEIGGQGFGFGVENIADRTESRMLGSGDDAIKIDVTVMSGEGGQNVAKIYICKQNENHCVKSAQAVLNVNPDISPSVWQTSTETGERLFLVLQPV